MVWPATKTAMADRIREFDWSMTLLGPSAEWDSSFRVMVDVLLAMPSPALLLWGPSHVQIYNDGYVAVAQARHPELLGKAVAEGWAEAYEDVLEPLLSAAFSGLSQSLPKLRVTLRGADGQEEERVFDTEWCPVRDAGGAVAGVLHTLTEVTPHHRALAALRASDQRLRGVLDGMAEAFGLLAPDFTILDQNEEALRLDGRPRDQIVGRSHWEAFPGSEDTELGQVLKRAMAERVQVSLELLYTCKQGHARWLAMRAYPTDDGALAVFWRDITDRKRAESEMLDLQKQQAFLLKLSDALRAERGGEAVVTRGVTMLAEQLKLDRCYAAAMSPDEDRAEVVGELRRPGLPPLPSSLHFSDYPETARRAMDQTLVFNDTAADPDLSDEDRTSLGALGFRALLSSFARRGEGNPILSIGAVSGHPRYWTQSEILLLEEATERIWAAIEHARAEEALRESEQRFRLIVENARDYAIFTMDREGRIADWFTGAELVFGWSAQEARGLTFDMTFTLEDRAAGVPAYEIDTARREGAAQDVRWHLRKDGTRIFIDGVTTSIRDAEGNLLGFLKIGQDVSDRRAAQEALRQSEERFRSFADASDDVLWIIDARTRRMEYISHAFERVWGEPCEAVMADLGLWDLRIHPDDLPAPGEGLDALLSGRNFTAEYRVQRRDGTVRYVRDTGFAIFDDDGKVRRVAGLAQDLTARRIAERAVIDSERRARTLMEGIPQLVWRSHDEGRWTWSSPQWQEFTGQTQEESHGLGWLDAVHPDDHAAAIAAWEGARDEGKLDVEYRVKRTSDGAYIWHHTRSLPVRDDAGHILEWLGTTTDVQQLKELQGQHGILVAELQHRTRNLMGVVRSIFDMTARASEDLTDFRLRFRDRLDALARVQGLLSRLNEHDRVTFDELVRAELLAFEFSSERVSLDGPEGVRLRSSTLQTLAMALHELATNALKYGAFSQPSGHLAIRWWLESSDPQIAPRLHIDWRETGVRKPAGSFRIGQGQGRNLIEQALPYQLGAETSFTFEPDGVHCTICIPLARRRMEYGDV